MSEHEYDLIGPRTQRRWSKRYLLLLLLPLILVLCAVRFLLHPPPPPHRFTDKYPSSSKPFWSKNFITYLDQLARVSQQSQAIISDTHAFSQEWYYVPGELPIPGTPDPQTWYDYRHANPPFVTPDLAWLESPVRDEDYLPPQPFSINSTVSNADFSRIESIIYDRKEVEIPGDDIMGSQADWLEPEWTLTTDEEPHAMPKMQAPKGSFSKSHSTRRRANYRKEVVKRAFFRTWTQYKTRAWASDEIGPVSGRPSNNYNGWAATVVDSLDTLLLMGFTREYEDAREIVKDIDFRINGFHTPTTSSPDNEPLHLFETVIRYLGGLLAAYDMSGDRLMLARAMDLAHELKYAFHTPTGIPQAWIVSGKKAQVGRTVNPPYMLAEVALQLEFARLAQVTGEKRWLGLAHRGLDWFIRHKPGVEWLDGDVPAITSSRTGYSLGGMADSYFEYLIKTHLLLDGALPIYAEHYRSTAQAMIKNLWRDITFIPGWILGTFGYHSNTGTITQLEHLTCFAGGMFAMGSKLLTDRHQDWTYARTFADTCYFSYDYTISGVGAEIITFKESYQHRPVRRAETAQPLMLSDGITNSNPMYAIFQVLYLC